MKIEKENGQKREKGCFSFTIFSIALICVALLLSNISTNLRENVNKISYSDFLEAIDKGTLKEVKIVDKSTIFGKVLANNGQYVSFSVEIPYEDPNLIGALNDKDVMIYGQTTKPSIIEKILGYLPWIFSVLLILLILRNQAAHNSNGMKFSESRAKIYDKTKSTVKFDDVAGQKEAKEELAEIVDFLKYPTKYEKIGAKIPHGILLVGNPGTGKTLLARAVAGEAGVNFLHISGSDFVEMFVGVGASRVRNLFAQARKMSPCVIFIDEIDAVGRARGAGLGGGHDEREQTLNQILVEMDGFEKTEGVIVLAATNRPDVLDQALLRPGRFDRQVTVAMPDIKEREAILQVHIKKVPVSEEFDIKKLARATSGMSGADLSNIVNEAAIYAARKNKDVVENAEFEEARDKVLMGIPRKSLVLSDKDKLMTAYHESGHALPYYFLKNATNLHKVTIIPRERALGVTVGLPKDDSYTHTKGQLEDKLVIMFGGYVAERLIYGETTTGTQNDLQQATELAHRMVCQWGMSKLGAICYNNDEEPVFMGKEMAKRKGLSDYAAEEIDKAVREILKEAENQAEKILSENKDKLDILAKTLVEKETLDDNEIKELLGFN